MGKKGRRNRKNKSGSATTADHGQEIVAAAREAESEATSFLALPIRNDADKIAELREKYIQNDPVNLKRQELEDLKAKVAGFINPDDDFDRFLSLLKPGKSFGAKWLRKKIPRTIQDLRENKIDKKKFCINVVDYYGSKIRHTSILHPLIELYVLMIATIPSVLSVDAEIRRNFSKCQKYSSKARIPASFRCHQTDCG